MRFARSALTALVVATLVVATLQSRGQDTTHRNDPPAEFDQLLDLQVVDGMVYYRTLKAQRGALDRYVEWLATADLSRGSYEQQLSSWINAYNALVLRTVIDNYPIVARSDAYPASSIRQIPGAFERVSHRVAGRSLTLDQIEQTVLPQFQDPRVFLALGRGAAGSARLRSEAYTPERLERQLAEAAAECADHEECMRIDRLGNRIRVSSVFSWRQVEFVAAYADAASPAFSARSPIERAVVAFITPSLYGAERAFLEGNRFAMEYIPFDWKLNDMALR